jgi:DNA-binding GntR family transcriptional regulator
MPRRVVAVSIADAVSEDIRQRLYRAEYPPGTSFTEASVSQTYEVSRPTAKVAIERMVSEGLLTRHVNKSAQVPTLNVSDVRDIYNSRVFLESEVLRQLARSRNAPAAAAQANRDLATIAQTGEALAIVEPDMRFHLSLVAAVGSPRTDKMYASLANEVRLCMVHVQGRALLPSALIHAEHERILQCIRAGDPEGVATALAEHLTRARERLVAAIGGEAGPEAVLPPSCSVDPAALTPPS